jgi:hypothetical protein
MGSSSSIGSEVRSAKPEAKEQREKPTVTRANSADGRFHTIPDPNRPSFVPSLKLDKARPLARRRRRHRSTDRLARTPPCSHSSASALPVAADGIASIIAPPRLLRALQREGVPC